MSEPVIDTTTFLDDSLYHITTSSNHSSEETWKLFFDGASTHRGCGIGILLISPDARHTPMSIKLDFEVTNNAAEYEACLQGLRAALALNIKSLQVFGDSSLIINQVSGAWKIRSESLALYQNCIDKLIKQFNRINFTYLPREENQFADALAKLSSIINIPHHMCTLPILVERKSKPAYINVIDGDEPPPEPWYQKILNFKEHGEYPP